MNDAEKEPEQEESKDLQETDDDKDSSDNSEDSPEKMHLRNKKPINKSLTQENYYMLFSSVIYV